MNSNRRALALALALAGMAGMAPALAQPAPVDPFGDAAVPRAAAEADAARRFDTLDANHDGVLSAEEMAAARPQGMGERGPERRGGGGRMGRMADANGDGKITKDEFVAAQLRRFDRIDTDHDGNLTKAERQAAFEAMRARMMERMAGNAMGGGMGDDAPPAGN